MKERICAVLMTATPVLRRRSRGVGAPLVRGHLRLDQIGNRARHNRAGPPDKPALVVFRGREERQRPGQPLVVRSGHAERHDPQRLQAERKSRPERR